jgi:proline iminopeptidase
LAGWQSLICSIRPPSSFISQSTPTLAPLPDTDPPPSLAERASAEAAEISKRLFSGDFSAETLDAFGRSVLPFYAGPRHTDIPDQLMRLSGFSPEVAGNFFGTAAATSYDLRPYLHQIDAPTLIIVGRYDWVCPPVAGRLLASQIPDGRLVEIAEAGHFPFSEEPKAFHDAVAAFVQSSSNTR